MMTLKIDVHGRVQVPAIPPPTPSPMHDLGHSDPAPTKVNS